MKPSKALLLGNEAIARGLVEAGCAVATAYPGTPSSEILPAVARFKAEENLGGHVQWAVNEKVAFEIAYAASIAGLRAAVSMKQVGLNVASDPLMSAAYMGAKGGFLVISADDPGPHSSQTEQDSRLMAMMAKVPVLDPATPLQAKQMVATGFRLSEKFSIPVLLRPTTRVCHSRQDIEMEVPAPCELNPDYQKDPLRWAATPKFRFKLHGELEDKLARIAGWEATGPIQLNRARGSALAVVASGVAAAHAAEIFKSLGIWESLPLYQVLQPYPLHGEFRRRILEAYQSVLVLEETTGVIEMQLASRGRVRGKMSGDVPAVGEMLPEDIEQVVAAFAGLEVSSPRITQAAGRRPTLCAGCPHRAAFFAIKKAAPKGIYPSDIGCYTLGLNLGAVDTVLCMGAAVSQAAGFHHALKNQDKKPPIVATIGDSTFFHSGIAPLVDSVVQKVPFVLVILDNATTAMTGNQPTAASGWGVSQESLERVDLAQLVKGCGVGFCRQADPYNIKEFTALLRQALSYCQEHGPAVVISKRPCLLDLRRKGGSWEAKQVVVTDTCDGCGFCVSQFECPALVLAEGDKQVALDTMICTGCGVCVEVCPKRALEVVK